MSQQPNNPSRTPPVGPRVGASAPDAKADPVPADLSNGAPPPPRSREVEIDRLTTVLREREVELTEARSVLAQERAHIDALTERNRDLEARAAALDGQLRADRQEFNQRWEAREEHLKRYVAELSARHAEESVEVDRRPRAASLLTVFVDGRKIKLQPGDLIPEGVDLSAYPRSAVKVSS